MNEIFGCESFEFNVSNESNVKITKSKSQDKYYR